MRRSYILFAALFSVGVLAQVPADQESKSPEDGLNYGHPDGLSVPKTILFSVSPDEILADAEEWSKRGINAFFVDYVAREWSSDIWAADGEPWTIGASDKTLQKTKLAIDVCRRIGSDTFLKVSFDHPLEWFNDTAWQRIENNFRQFAIFARETGCTGVAVDIEYVGPQYAFDWPGYDYKGYTRKDLAKKVRDRATLMISAMYDEFPDMVFLTFPEEGFTLGSAIHAAWIEEAAKRNAPGGVHYCTEWTYRNPNVRYVFAHAWGINQLFQGLLSDSAKKYWQEKCSICMGVWPLGFDYHETHDPGLTLDQWRQGLAASLMVSRKYNWIYSHNSRPQLIGRDLDKVSPGVNLQPYLDCMAKKEMINDPKYVALANDLREMKSRDYAADLGLRVCARFIGPAETPELSRAKASVMTDAEMHTTWNLAAKYISGEPVTLREVYHTITDWMVIGPFANPGAVEGKDTAFPPEQSLDIAAEYDGVAGKVKWKAHHEAVKASVDLSKLFAHTEHVCAYALCYVTSPVEQAVQFRVGTNDAGKLWVGGKLVWDYPHLGGAVFDRDIVAVTLPQGVTPILLKVTNDQMRWGFVVRITDATGQPIDGLSYSPHP